MRYYKVIMDNCLTIIGVGDGGIEITETEYNEIREIIRSKPAAPVGYSYRLTESLEWELYELPEMPEEEEEPMDETAAKAQAYDILTGGAE